ncbi:uncharacterized protein LOC123531825 [Mercenaria mercenaria]|uniref:uncharacterized protein LOC123531825 n=1 Tax=Mercenaria mercenaria TaxID=6596 RepID=UPI001E1DC9F5|nr:uncharacterized protein LOC123531825 [Mercenaria mercenaria]
MRHKQLNPVKRAMKHKGYSPSALFNAYKLVKETGIPVKTAARQYGVPHNTLRDRVKGRVDPETLMTGPGPLFTQEEEAKLVEHIKHMADLGYGFTITEVVSKASDYAVFLKKRSPDKPLSVKWFSGFRKRWPELRVTKPRALTKCRAASTSQQAVNSYFTNLETVIMNNNLLNKPECIYNIDEKGIQTEHSPPYIVGGKASVPAITSSRSAVTTIIGGGNAIGTQVPPFFVFKGQRMNEDLLQGAASGSAGTMSKTGWSNSVIFHEYLESHFLKYIQRPDSNQPVLVIFDGHRSHINVPVLEWAKRNNIILFVLPAHTSHCLQPLDVGCFGPLQKIYNNTCHKFLREHPSSKITRFNVAALASSSYVTALSNNNLKSAFQKTGIFPLDRTAISTDNFKPSEPYVAPVQEPSEQVPDVQCDLNAYFRAAETVIELKKEFHQASAKKTFSNVVSGQEITSSDISQQIITKPKPIVKQPTKTPRKPKSNIPKKVCKKSSSKEKPYVQPIVFHHPEPTPGPSHINLLLDTDSNTDDSDDDMPDEDKCCVCKLFQPAQLKNCVSLVITKWAQCDSPGCKHWTHLIYCCKQRVIRRNDTFICPCHDQTNTEE